MENFGHPPDRSVSQSLISSRSKLLYNEINYSGPLMKKHFKTRTSSLKISIIMKKNSY